MKKRIASLVLTAVLLLSGCGAKQELPSGWETDWTAVCPVLAVEPLDGFTLHESNDALYLSGIYYATCVTGESRPHTNEEGEEAEVFDAQIYVIVQEYRDPDSAAEGIAQWIAREKTTFEAGTQCSFVCNDQEYAVLPLAGGSENNPYRHGVAAFGLRNNWAVCVEFLGTEDYEADFENTLEAFLNSFHYAA